MGVVYRAHDSLLEREVALKIISASIEGNPELRERFYREARAAGQLSHRNIITIHDLGEHDGQPYLAMEYLNGEDLQRRLSRPEPMSLARKLEIAADICDGLSYAHRRGLIHRDIKPANIFITDEGVVKLLDFGLARMVTSELTASNMMLGTLNYMAPEQVRGERTDHRADIFSFGVVLYEILSGRKAFQGDSFATTLYKILQDVPEPLQNIDASLPYEVVRGAPHCSAWRPRTSRISGAIWPCIASTWRFRTATPWRSRCRRPSAPLRRTVCRRIRRVQAGFRAPIPGRSPNPARERSARRRRRSWPTPRQRFRPQAGSPRRDPCGGSGAAPQPC